MRNIYVYTGLGAYQARDIENFLAVFEYDYLRISENDFDQMSSSDVLIVPGGEIESYIPAWKKSGVEIIKKFVSSGGIYIGICAGAYVAGRDFEGVHALSFFGTDLMYKKGHGIINVTNAIGEKCQLINENGPDLSGISADEIILKDINNKPYAIKLNYGQGYAYLFSAHPEGSVYYKQYPDVFTGARFLDHFIKSLPL